MSFQYTFDSKGKTIGVFVPLQEWVRITDALKKRKTSSKIRKKNKVLLGIEKGISEVNQIEKGKLKPISLKKLLNEL